MTQLKDTDRSWAEHFVDTQVDRAWLGLRMDLADRFDAGLGAGEMEPVEITSADGKTLVADVCDGHVAVIAGERIVATSNVDEAAFEVVDILRRSWQVIHPLFLDTDLVHVPVVDDNRGPTVVPTLGRAESREQLQAWVVASFERDRDEPLLVSARGNIPWEGRHGSAVVVSVRSEHWIEIWTVLAREVSFKRARRELSKLAHRYTGVSFHLDQDTILTSRVVDASPYVPEHVQDALTAHIELAGRLTWLENKVLRKRVKAERAALAEAKEAKAASEEALANAQARIDLLEASRARVRRRGIAAARQRSAAEEELVRLKARIERLLIEQREREDGAA